jgi:hypothetical protein
MPFAKGQSGNPGGEWKDKPFRRALLMEAKLAEKGQESPAPKGSLRYIARQLLNRAGEETAAAREIGDRLDGRPAQAIVGDDQLDPIRHVQEVRRIIVRSENG